MVFLTTSPRKGDGPSSEMDHDRIDRNSRFHVAGGPAGTLSGDRAAHRTARLCLLPFRQVPGQDCIAETVALAWKWVRRLADRGKDATHWPMEHGDELAKLDCELPAVTEYHLLLDYRDGYPSGDCLGHLRHGHCKR